MAPVVVVVEPVAALGGALRDLLEIWGMRAEVVPTVTAALELVEGVRPDAVILDVAPAVGDGIGLVQHLKGRRDRAGALVVVLSAGIDPTRVAGVLAAGADGVVRGPDDLAELEARLRRLPPGASGPARSEPSRATRPAGPGPRVIAGSAERALLPLALAVYRNRARSHHECARSRRLAARARAICALAHQLRAAARERDAPRPARVALQLLA